jgi:hypothetical protein
VKQWYRKGGDDGGGGGGGTNGNQRSKQCDRRCRSHFISAHVTEYLEPIARFYLNNFKVNIFGSLRRYCQSKLQRIVHEGILINISEVNF